MASKFAEADPRNPWLLAAAVEDARIATLKEGPPLAVIGRQRPVFAFAQLDGLPRFFRSGALKIDLISAGDTARNFSALSARRNQATQKILDRKANALAETIQRRAAGSSV